MIGTQEITPDLARHILERMGSTGQPPERGARFVNVATEELLAVMRDEYLVPMKSSGKKSTFKLVQAPFGGGKTHFLHCLRELAWSEDFATALVGLSPKECPFDRPVSVYKEVALRVELPVQDLDEEPSQGIDRVLRQIAEQRMNDLGAEPFLKWLKTDLRPGFTENRSFGRAVRAFLEAVVTGEVEAEELLGDYLRGDTIGKQELTEHSLRTCLGDEIAFQWLRSLAQALSALGLPGVVLMFDEMDRNMSLGPKRRQAIGDNLRQMIDYCGQSLLPGVVWCYAVPPEFMDTIVPEYPALAQRLKGASRFSNRSPMQPIIDLDHLSLGPVELLNAIGLKLLQLSRIAHDHEFDEKIQNANLSDLAAELGERQFESGTRREFVKAAVTMIEAQRREGERALSREEISRLAGSGDGPDIDPLPGETEF